jgi:hypothetical protein
MYDVQVPKKAGVSAGPAPSRIENVVDRRIAEAGHIATSALCREAEGRPVPAKD